MEAKPNPVLRLLGGAADLSIAAVATAVAILVFYPISHLARLVPARSRSGQA